MRVMAKETSSNSHVGRPQLGKGSNMDKVKVIVEMPRGLRDAALRRAREQDVSLSKVLREATRGFVDGRLSFSLIEE